jgi:hypothetical protein
MLMGFNDLPEHKQNAIIMMVTGDPENPFKRMKYKDIAEKLGIAEYTLRRWRADPEFQEAKREFREKYVKDDIVDEAVRTLFRSMRTKDSTHAAEVALKYAGEMVERRAIDATVTSTQQIDLRSSDTQELLAKLQEYHKQLGLPDNIELYIGQGEVIDGEIVEDESVSTDSTEDVDNDGK